MVSLKFPESICRNKYVLSTALGGHKLVDIQFFYRLQQLEKDDERWILKLSCQVDQFTALKRVKTSHLVFMGTSDSVLPVKFYHLQQEEKTKAVKFMGYQSVGQTPFWPRKQIRAWQQGSVAKSLHCIGIPYGHSTFHLRIPLLIQLLALGFRSSQLWDCSHQQIKIK